MSGIGRKEKKTQNKRQRTLHNGRAIVGVLGGSKSDFPILEKAGSILAELQIPYELLVVSAHRTPDRLFEYASTRAVFVRREVIRNHMNLFALGLMGHDVGEKCDELG